MARVSKLTRGGEVLAVFRPVGRWRFADYPCIETTYETTPAYEELRPLFQRELELMEVDSEPENSEWLEIWEQLKAPGLFVEARDGRERLDILWIHFREDRAWYWPLFASPETRLARVVRPSEQP
jgi:hypothetical protein